MCLPWICSFTAYITIWSEIGLFQFVYNRTDGYNKNHIFEMEIGWRRCWNVDKAFRPFGKGYDLS